MFDLIRELRFEWRRRMPPLRRNAFEERRQDPVYESQSLIPAPWLRGLSDLHQRISLAYAEWLEQVPREFLGSINSCVEIGVMNYSYAAGVASWLHRLNPQFQLEAIEADGFVTYANGYRRRDAAQFYVRRLNDLMSREPIQYQDANWLCFQEAASWDLVLCFFPFLWSDLSKAWGLPRDHFDVECFYRKALQQGRRVIFFHQGEEEFLESKRWVNELDGKILFERSSIENQWIKRKHPVGVLVFCQKN